MKLNFGSANKRIGKDFINVDALAWDNADIIWDLTKTPYDFADENSVDEIVAQEFLEHISWRDTHKVLVEWHRILKKGGKLTIQVPACDKMMEFFVNKQINQLVPHKPESKEKVLKFQKKTGLMVNPTRWLMAFCGAQKHDWDNHLNIFTKNSLKDELVNVGFEKIKIGYDDYQWKLIAEVYK